MSQDILEQGCLVLYKNRPARVAETGDRLEIELEDGKTQKVRQKDVVMLHPGPLLDLAALQAPQGDVDTAWELLAGDTTSLLELAELIYGDYTPATAWATWQLVAEGVYFRGTPEFVEVSSAEEVERLQSARQARQQEEAAWTAFVSRVRGGNLGPAADSRFLREVEDLALGRRTNSRLLRELGRSESPEKAHDLLLRLKYWDYQVDPYPQRLQLPTTPPSLPLPALPEEPRKDLTHLPAFAIDDEGSQDPDDALSLDDGRLWVHVADVAALVAPGSEVDLEARARGANLYLPEQTIPMLPAEATQCLGLGLRDVSPALSFGLTFDAAGDINGVEVVPSWVKVTRLTYAEAELRLADAPFDRLYALALRNQERRRAGGAISIELPESKVSVQDGRVMIEPLPALRSRDMVQEAMLMAGEAAARYALQHQLPFPFTTQAVPDLPEASPDGLAGMFAIRRSFKRSQQTSVPAPHAGLGLTVYARVTSPLRRYLDLVVHQQLRAHLRGDALLGEQEMLGRVGAAEAVTGSVRQAEQLATRHWTLVYLQQHPNWSGEGTLVDKRQRRGTVLISELGLEVRLHLPADLPLNSSIPLILNGVNLAELDTHFQIAS
jgi:exoribonuclease-2